MQYVIAYNYLCLFALLEMIIKDSTTGAYTQKEMAEVFGVTVPYGYETDLNNVKYSANQNMYGAKLSAEMIQEYFDTHGIGLKISYIDGLRLPEIDIEERLADYLNKNKYIILAYSYGVLSNMSSYNALGHVALLEKVNKDDTIVIYDPGPREAGTKLVNIWKMYDAIQRKGGVYVFERC